jgi:hypothetical protein
MLVSTYRVLIDGPFDLNAQAIKRFTQPMPPSSEFVKETAKPILCFNIQPLTSAHLKFAVFLNDHAATQSDSKIAWVYDNADDIKLLRSIHEMLDADRFLPGADNLIDFKVIIGKARFSDVVLFFRVET